MLNRDTSSSGATSKFRNVRNSREVCNTRAAANEGIEAKNPAKSRDFNS
jgi:hypothetical protein